MVGQGRAEWQMYTELDDLSQPRMISREFPVLLTMHHGVLSIMPSNQNNQNQNTR